MLAAGYMNDLVRCVLLCVFIAVSTRNAPASEAEAKVTVVHPPPEALVPDVALDPKGTLHLLYGIGSNAFYVCSKDNGLNFIEPVKVNTGVSVETRMGERGPKIALGRDGVIHVVWMDLLGARGEDVCAPRPQS